MNKSFTNTLKYYIPEVILFSIFIVIQLSHINSDLWNDEIFTIKHFVLVPISATVSESYMTNNHILLNLISNLYLRIVGIDSLGELFPKPWILRLIPFFFSIVTAYFTYKIGSKFINRTVGCLALVILMTSIPFYTHSLQIRGYGLSIMFAVTLVYFILSYLRNIKRINLFIIAIMTCLMLYTLPSNLFYIIAILIGVTFYYILDNTEHITLKNIINNKYSFVVYSICGGVGLALLLFLPIFGQVFNNEFVDSQKLYEFHYLKGYLQGVFYGITHNRWIIIGLAALGFILGYKYILKHIGFLILCATMIIVPIVIVWTLGQFAPVRVYTVCLPFASLVLAISLLAGWKVVTKKFNLHNEFLVGAVSIITLISLVFQLNKVEHKMLTDIENSNSRIQNMYYQYYAARYEPFEDLMSFKAIYKDEVLPIVIVRSEPEGIRHYLDAFDIPHFPNERLDSLLLNHSRLYVITNHPNDFLNRKDIEAKVLNDELNFHNFIVITTKN